MERWNMIQDRPRRFADQLELLFWLWMLPVATTDQLALATGFSYDKVSRILKGLIRRELVATRRLRGNGSRRPRYWPSRRGVMLVAKEYRLSVPWQVSEEAIDLLIRRMAVVEYFYDLALSLWEHQGVRYAGVIRPREDGFLGPEDYPEPERLLQFHWHKGAGLDAVAVYRYGAWVSLIWVGQEATYHELRHRAERVQQALVVTTPAGDRVEARPWGWAIVCADQLAAAHASEQWLDRLNVLAVTVAGDLERVMETEAGSWQTPDRAEIRDPGFPERAARWAKRDTPLSALEHRLSYPMLRSIAEFRGGTRDQLGREFGDGCGKALQELLDHELVRERNGRMYATLKGGRALADMDGVDYERVEKRLQTVLKGDDDWRRQQERHDGNLVEVRLKLKRDGIECSGGHRNLVNVTGVTQVSPDAALCIVDRYSMTRVVDLELEFTARDDGRMEGKLETRWLANGCLPRPILSVWLLEDESVRRRYARAGGDLPMLTATLSDFLSGTSWGANSVWRTNGGRSVSISHLVYPGDEWVREDRE